MKIIFGTTSRSFDPHFLPRRDGAHTLREDVVHLEVRSLRPNSSCFPSPHSEPTLPPSAIMKFTLAAAAFALGAASTVQAASVGTVDSAKKLKRGLFENLVKRQSVTSGADDATVLNFALTLEHLEAKFYADALAKFDQNCFDQKGYYHLRPLLEQVAADEADHVTFLTTALKAANVTAVQPCTYSCTFPRSLSAFPPLALTRNFHATVPYTDVPDFLALAQVVENVGVSAYLGAAGESFCRTLFGPRVASDIFLTP